MYCVGKGNVIFDVFLFTVFVGTLLFLSGAMLVIHHGKGI